MAVESLLKQKINISEMNLPEGGSESGASSLEALTALKQTFFFDEENDLWAEIVAREGGTLSYRFDTPQQLLWLLAEGASCKRDRKKASKKYMEYKQDPNIYEESGVWNVVNILDRTAIHGSRMTQLLGVLAEIELGDFADARRRYQDLKSTYYNNGWEMRFRNGEMRRPTCHQLVGILIEEALGIKYKAELKEEYEYIKFAYMKDQKWVNYIDEEGGKRDGWDGCCLLNDQLWGVMVESLFDKKEAKRQYRNLKEDPKFFNEDSGFWQENGDTHYLSTRDQLTAILAKAFLDRELEEKDNFLIKTEPMPEWKNF